MHSFIVYGTMILLLFIGSVHVNPFAEVRYRVVSLLTEQCDAAAFPQHPSISCQGVGEAKPEDPAVVPMERSELQVNSSGRVETWGGERDEYQPASMAVDKTSGPIDHRLFALFFVASTILGGLLYRTRRQLAHSKAQLRSTREELKAVVKSLPDVLMALDAKGNCDRIYHTRQGGVEALDKNLRGRNLSDLVDVEDSRCCADAVRECIQDGFSYGRQVRFQGALFELSVVRMPEDMTVPVSLVAYLKNTSADQDGPYRRKVKCQLLESLVDKRQVIDSLELVVRYIESPNTGLQAGILLVDAQHRLTTSIAPDLPKSWLVAIERLLNEVYIGDKCVSGRGSGHRLVIGDIQGDSGCSALSGLARELGIGACWFEPVHGVANELLGVIAVFKGSSGEPTISESKSIRLAGLLAAITIKHNNLSASLRAAERRFRTITEHSPHFISRYDRLGRRIYVNPKLKALFDQPVDRFLKKRPLEFSPIQNKVRFMEMIRRTLNTRSENSWEFSYVDQQGSIRWGHMHLVPELDELGESEGVLAVTTDITDLKCIEQSLEESYVKISDLAAAQEAVREQERSLIARELHDELGQILTAIRIELSSLKLRNYTTNSGQLLQKVSQIKALADRAAHGVRDVVSLLHPAILEQGVVAALQWLTGEFQAKTGITCELDADTGVDTMAELNAVAVFRISQESLTNVARHSGAKKVHVRLRQSEKDYVLRICDDGKGFDPSKHNRKSMGLIGMKERVNRLKGKLELCSEIGKGTELLVQLPRECLHSKDKKDEVGMPGC